jgi:hypothetical protein
MDDLTKSTISLPLAPHIRQYPLNIPVVESNNANCLDGTIFPVEELQNRLNLSVAQHYSWIIPDFSEKIFLSLHKNLCPHTDPDHAKDILHTVNTEYPMNYTPKNEGFDILCADCQNIGCIEISSLSDGQLKGLFTIADDSYFLQVQNVFPLDCWIIIDTAYKTAILYISSDLGNAY